MQKKLLLAATLAASSALSAAVLVSDTFATNSLANYVTPTGRTTPVYDSGNGIAGGSLDHSGVAGATNNQVYNTAFGDFTSENFLGASIYFKTTSLNNTAGNANLATISVGANNDILATTDQISIESVVRLNSGNNSLFLRTRSYDTTGGTPVTNSSSTFSLTEGNWYQLELTLTKSGNDFAVSTQLIDWGANGLTNSGVVISASPSFTNAALANDSSIFAGFGMATNGTGLAGADRLDNFSTIPEPSTYAAIAGALALGLVAYRRRR